MKNLGIGTDPVGFRKLGRSAAAIIVIAVLAVVWAAADAPPGPYFNGFETNTAGWFNYVGATVSRVPSGSASMYANGVVAASGNYYARLGIEPSPPHDCGGKPWFVGPYTDFGGDTSGLFPPGGYTTGVDIYLDVPYALIHPDTRFDWSSEINDPSGNFRRDFVFNVGTDLLGFVMTGGNNATRCGANPADPNPGHAPIVHITQSGWYTFKHTFTGVAGGPLTVTLQVMPSGSNVPLGTWIRSDPSDIIGTTVGGNSDGWFAQNEFDGLAIDNSFRTGIVSTPNCELKINDGGWIFALNTDVGTFGGNAKVSSSGIATGNQEYHDHGPLQPITVNTIDVQAVTCSSDRTQASIFGRTTVDGSGSYEYEIDLQDNGEPGVDDMYRIFIPGIAYESGLQKLQGGNVQIR